MTEHELRAEIVALEADRARLQQQLVLGAAKLRANATTGMNGASISNWALWLETLAKDCESRGVDGDTHPMVKGLGEGVDLSSTQRVVPPLQGDEHARHTLSAESSLKPADGSNPSDSLTPRPVGAHRDCHDLSCNAHREYPRGAKGVCCSCSGRDAAYEALAALRQALTHLPRYWVTIVRAFPEPMACLGTELGPEGEWVKYEDVQRAAGSVETEGNVP